MTRYCSCGGANASCYKCSGTGILPVSTDDRPSRKLPHQTKQPKSGWVICEHCASPVLEKNYPRHLTKIHSPGLKPVQASPSKATQPPVPRQPVQKLPLPPSVSRPAPETRIFQIQGDPRINPVKGLEQGRQSAQSNTDSAEVDTNKGLGYFRREAGKFGSYPLCDDYSEESEP